MNTLVAAVAVGVAAYTALAQGQFYFGNRVTVTVPPIDARAWEPHGTPLTGNAYLAQAYVGLTADSLEPTGLAVPFRTGAAAGYITTTLVTTRFPGGTAILVEMRVWDAAGGASYEAALAAGKLAGRSNPVLLTVTEPPDLPPYMLGLCSWSWPPPVPRPPGILHQPSGRRVALGSELSIEMWPTGSEPLRLQWHRDAQVLAGETFNRFSVAQARWTDAGDYYVTVANAWGVVTSEVARVVVGYPLMLTTNGPGGIEVQPPLEVFDPGQTAQLTAVPATQRTFLGWHGDASGTGNPVTLTMDGPRRVRAHFLTLTGDLKWRFLTGGGGYVASSPALGRNGAVYVGSSGPKVYALDGATGEKLWDFARGAVDSSPAIGENGTVYVGPSSGRVYALDGGTGNKLWEFAAGESSADSSPAIGADGTVFVYVYPRSDPGQDIKLYALDGGTGRQVWEFASSRTESSSQGGWSGLWCSPAVGADGTVYVGSVDGKIYAVNGATGQKVWEFTTREDPGGGVAARGEVWRSAAIGADGTVYAGSQWGDIYALDGATGEKRWAFPTWGSDLACSPTIGTDGTVFVGYSFLAGGSERISRVLRLEGATGGRGIQFDTAGGMYSTPTIGADGTVYVGSGDHKILAVNGATGERVWEYVTGGEVWSSPALGEDGTVYVGSNDGVVYALQGTSGLAGSPWPKFRADAQNTGRGRPPVPLRLAIARQLDKVRLAWTPPAVLQSSDALAPAAWQDLAGATNPFEVQPANAQRFYRLRLP